MHVLGRKDQAALRFDCVHVVAVDPAGDADPGHAADVGQLGRAAGVGRVVQVAPGAEVVTEVEVAVDLDEAEACAGPDGGEGAGHAEHGGVAGVVIAADAYRQGTPRCDNLRQGGDTFGQALWLARVQRGVADVDQPGRVAQVQPGAGRRVHQTLWPGGTQAAHEGACFLSQRAGAVAGADTAGVGRVGRHAQEGDRAGSRVGQQARGGVEECRQRGDEAAGVKKGPIKRGRERRGVHREDPVSP